MTYFKLQPLYIKSSHLPIPIFEFHFIYFLKSSTLTPALSDASSILSIPSFTSDIRVFIVPLLIPCSIPYSIPLASTLSNTSHILMFSFPFNSFIVSSNLLSPVIADINVKSSSTCAISVSSAI